MDPIVSMSGPTNPEQLGGPDMAANNAQRMQQMQAQEMIKRLLLQRAMQAQGMTPSGGYQPPGQPPMLGAPPRPPQMYPGMPPMGGVRG